MTSVVEQSEDFPPAWLEKLENRIKKGHRLAHDIGNGSPCLKCQNDCAGLDLHFWRKICRNCKCRKEDHDVKEEDLDTHFDIIFGRKKSSSMPSKKNLSSVKYPTEEKAEEIVLDWLPENISTELAEKFVSSFPRNRLPITGSSAAQERVRQLKKQIPLHDLDPKFCHQMSEEESKSLAEYSSNLRDKAMGQADVVIVPPEGYQIGKSVEIGGDKVMDGSGSVTKKSPTVDNITNDLHNTDLNRVKEEPNSNWIEEGEKSARKGTVQDKCLCQHCMNEIPGGDAAVYITLPSSTLTWHPSCFVCNCCKEFLVDLIYFMKDGKVFCGRDYALQCNIPRCFSCDELVFSNQYTLTEGKTYHVHHFCCLECDKWLENENYIIKMDHPVCMNCFHVKYAKVCVTCGETILAKESGIALNNLTWHADGRCFYCHNCLKNLVQSKFTLKYSRPYCSKECALKASP